MTDHTPPKGGHPHVSTLAQTIPSDSIPARGSRRIAGTGITLLSPLQKVLTNLGCRHQWGMPISVRSLTYPVANRKGYFDAHQSCLECGAQRLYDTRQFLPGPLFTHTVR